jgi:hypothetical protein
VRVRVRVRALPLLLLRRRGRAATPALPGRRRGGCAEEVHGRETRSAQRHARKPVRRAPAASREQTKRTRTRRRVACALAHAGTHPRVALSWCALMTRCTARTRRVGGEGVESRGGARPEADAIAGQRSTPSAQWQRRQNARALLRCTPPAPPRRRQERAAAQRGALLRARQRRRDLPRHPPSPARREVVPLFARIRDSRVTPTQPRVPLLPGASAPPCQAAQRACVHAARNWVRESGSSVLRRVHA